jgi:BirA family biotin operon repressor/biotin-[acetyl-CoA-carboxylase] ligase
MAVPIARSIKTPLLLALLADGELHSGKWLAGELRQTRATVCKEVERLRRLGIAVQAVEHQGYRLADGVELLDASRLGAELGARQRPCLRRLELLFEVDSTNTRLLGTAPPPPGSAEVCMSELQHAGRGRLGRRWIAPFGSGVSMSLSWTFRNAASTLSALSLGVGVAVSRALARAGAAGITLKWPNDIWFRDRKIGGVLIESRAEAGSTAHVVIGVGINVSLAALARQQIEAGGACVAAVADACVKPPSRNLVAGAILDELLSMLVLYERLGFAAFRNAWMALDALRGRQANVMLGKQATLGVARGVDADGALLLETGDGMQRFVSGEARLSLTRG